jgi:hypothetical protein
MSESSGDSYTGRFETLEFENDLSATQAISLPRSSGEKSRRFTASLFDNFQSHISGN